MKRRRVVSDLADECRREICESSSIKMRIGVLCGLDAINDPDHSTQSLSQVRIGTFKWLIKDHVGAFIKRFEESRNNLQRIK